MGKFDKLEGFNPKKALGDIGEEIIMTELRSRGHVISKSIDPLDKEKDIVMDESLKIEVKTQVPFFKKKAFTVRKNQLKKCLECSVLYIISAPAKYGTHDGTEGFVYKVDPKKLKYKFFKTNNGEERVLFEREQEAFVHDFTVTDKEILEVMRKYSSSTK